MELLLKGIPIHFLDGLVEVSLANFYNTEQILKFQFHCTGYSKLHTLLHENHLMCIFLQRLSDKQTNRAHS